MSGVVLLASYPKSGNTWTRAFLASLDSGGSIPDINALGPPASLSSRAVCDLVLDEDTGDLSNAEIARVRPWISRRVAGEFAAPVKAHDAWLVPPGATEPPFPADIIDRAILIVRDPRDVALSCVHHFGKPLARIVDDMADPDFALGTSGKHSNRQIYQFVSTWSGHVRSWLDQSDFPVRLIRYEDMITDPVASFTAAARFLGRKEDDATIARAVESSSFDVLVRQETRDGFAERLGGSNAPFFRSGRAGGWREAMPGTVAARIADDHGATMRRLGYL
ncbi:sulfotransferase domain-containing protein [Sphingomonas sp. So64.6b]|uniref:sulfotransferase domain-containing protein n=1 Tax=Sphingomonas sp. So64.6b TaxID=2997354 RepID=UPI001FCF095D|nr:sulfotransferase domain-containing protein [Sphingomonas sp. So64.6b]